mgnify:CR=1 FL=1
MFDNIGSKIKTVAEVIVWLSIIGWIIIGSVMIAEAKDSYYPSATETLGGWLVMIVGSFSSWLSSLALYGLGQLIENTDTISSEMESIRHITSEYVANMPNKAQEPSNNTESSTNSNDTISYTNLDPCLGTCDFCNKENVEVVGCKIVDSMGTRYRYLCADCMKKHNAVPIKK